MIRLLLVDDHVSSREPLAFMLAREDDIEVVATAGSIAEARGRLEEHLDVDVAVLDLGLPDGSGTQLIGAVHASNPRAVALVLTSFSDRRILAEAIEAGAAGVLHKSAGLADIIGAIRTLHAGDQLVSAREVSDAIRLAVSERRRRERERLMFDSLTARERDVLAALAEGLTDKELAARFTLSPATVRTHVNSVLAKLGVRSRLQAVVLAIRYGAVDPS